MQVTLREIRWVRVPLLIWLVVTVVAAVAGPFGTLGALETGARTAYWGAVAGGSIALNFAAARLARGRSRGGVLAVWVGFVLILSGLVHGINTAVFSAWGGWADWAYLAGTVGLVTVAVHLVIRVVDPPMAAAAQNPEPEVFARRLPIGLRAPLVRIEAQDHYLNVVTARGSTLILMRLGDAIAELSGQGVQVHRSHWVVPDSVTQHRRMGGRDLLVMSDGAQIPVSRSFRAAARAAGLI